MIRDFVISHLMSHLRKEENACGLQERVIAFKGRNGLEMNVPVFKTQLPPLSNSMTAHDKRLSSHKTIHHRNTWKSLHFSIAAMSHLPMSCKTYRKIVARAYEA